MNTQQNTDEAALPPIACQTTPHKELIRQIMDSRIPKNEREWAAAREIEDLRRKLCDRKRHLRAANKGAEIASLTAQLYAARNVKLADELYELRKQKTNENKVGTDPYMEEICDKIRRGEPVGFMDALAATEYQRQRKLQKPASLWKRVVRFFLPNN